MVNYSSDRGYIPEDLFKELYELAHFLGDRYPLTNQESILYSSCSCLFDRSIRPPPPRKRGYGVHTSPICLRCQIDW
ncbi:MULTISPECIES: hypothetical protein [Nostocales]|uniref:Uncharacterized protein n=2 Tax=Aphanizomenonaceae TaxID=1892259 RepID=A0ACC7S202_DOLFA|nr:MULTISPECIES: hypothetical protein [Nostocales]MBD2277315.1 hypothetical protein [Aphanizomenon flos-aquae FACHB-1040]MBO1063389.1 hypothetical protein [Anabaena sp. 54]MTJ42331.1 hypothetical protein [Dolichospermum flos-aquae UHCC 0037]